MVLSIAVPIFMFLEAETNLYIVVELLFFEYSHLSLLVFDMHFISCRYLQCISTEYVAFELLWMTPP